jgi:hypothetical protein
MIGKLPIVTIVILGFAASVAAQGDQCRAFSIN